MGLSVSLLLHGDQTYARLHPEPTLFPVSPRVVHSTQGVTGNHWHSQSSLGDRWLC